VRHSLARISKARELLGYTLMHRVRQGLKRAMGWQLRSMSRRQA
jgi:nucleoside-diphosphate-sugar epimerase